MHEDPQGVKYAGHLQPQRCTAFSLAFGFEPRTFHSLRLIRIINCSFRSGVWHREWKYLQGG